MNGIRDVALMPPGSDNFKLWHDDPVNLRYTNGPPTTPVPGNCKTVAGADPNSHSQTQGYIYPQWSGPQPGSHGSEPICNQAGGNDTNPATGSSFLKVNLGVIKVDCDKHKHYTWTATGPGGKQVQFKLKLKCD